MEGQIYLIIGSEEIYLGTTTQLFWAEDDDRDVISRILFNTIQDEVANMDGYGEEPGTLNIVIEVR